MRIISSFHDYYDGVQSYGQDQSLIYIRQKEYVDIHIKLSDHIPSRIWGWESPFDCSIITNPEKNIERERVGTLILGYCGELYRGHVIKTTVVKENSYYNQDSYNIVYSQTELDKYQTETEYSKKVKYKTKIINDRNNFEILNQIKLKEIFFDYKVPLFIIAEQKVKKCHKAGDYKGNLTLNPNLHKYKFQTIKDPFTVYQDISMFIGGVLPNPAKEMIEISDKDKALKRGFDKWSFRKVPNKT